MTVSQKFYSAKTCSHREKIKKIILKTQQPADTCNISGYNNTKDIL